MIIDQLLEFQTRRQNRISGDSFTVVKISFSLRNFLQHVGRNRRVVNVAANFAAEKPEERIRKAVAHRIDDDFGIQFCQCLKKLTWLTPYMQKCLFSKKRTNSPLINIKMCVFLIDFWVIIDFRGL